MRACFTGGNKRRQRGKNEQTKIHLYSLMDHFVSLNFQTDRRNKAAAIFTCGGQFKTVGSNRRASHYFQPKMHQKRYISTYFFFFN